MKKFYIFTLLSFYVLNIFAQVDPEDVTNEPQSDIYFKANNSTYIGNIITCDFIISNKGIKKYEGGALYVFDQGLGVNEIHTINLKKLLPGESQSINELIEVQSGEKNIYFYLNRDDVPDNNNTTVTKKPIIDNPAGNNSSGDNSEDNTNNNSYNFNKELKIDMSGAGICTGTDLYIRYPNKAKGKVNIEFEIIGGNGPYYIVWSNGNINRQSNGKFYREVNINSTTTFQITYFIDQSTNCKNSSAKYFTIEYNSGTTTQGCNFDLSLPSNIALCEDEPVKIPIEFINYSYDNSYNVKLYFKGPGINTFKRVKNNSLLSLPGVGEYEFTKIKMSNSCLNEISRKTTITKIPCEDQTGNTPPKFTPSNISGIYKLKQPNNSHPIKIKKLDLKLVVKSSLKQLRKKDFFKGKYTNSKSNKDSGEFYFLWGKAEVQGYEDIYVLSQLVDKNNEYLWAALVDSKTGKALEWLNIRVLPNNSIEVRHNKDYNNNNNITLLSKL